MNCRIYLKNRTLFHSKKVEKVLIFKIMRMTYCFAFFSLFIIQTLVAQQIKYPEFKLTKYNFIIPNDIFIPYTYKVDFDLQLTEESKKAFDETAKKIDDFNQKFKENQQRLEKQYEESSGESKIQNAHKLIEFILQSQREWQEITMPQSNKWVGKYSMNLDVMGFVQLNYNGDASINLTWKEQEDSLTTQLLKTIDGSVQGNVTAKLGLSMGEAVMNGNGSYVSEDPLNGFSDNGLWWNAKHEFIAKQGSFDFFANMGGLVGMSAHSGTQDGKTTTTLVVGGPFLYGEVKSNDAKVTGYVAVYEPITGSYIRKDINKPVEPPKPGYELDQFKYLQPEMESIDFQKYLDTYFKYYVSSINNVRGDQYKQETDVNERKKLTLKVLDELIGADILGQRICVSDFVFDELYLLINRYGSLFDGWFKLWFKDSEKYWIDKIASSGNTDERIENYQKRLINVLFALHFRDGMVTSEKLMNELELYPGSNFISNRIKDYYREANTKNCNGKTNHTMTPEAYSKWLNSIFNTAKCYGNEDIITLINTTHC